MKPLPRQIRIINRAILILLGILLLVQCGRCAFAGDPDENIPGEKSTEGITSADSSGQNSAKYALSSPAIDDSHIKSQKDTVLAQKIHGLLKTYKPDNALFLMVDAKTNEILAWGERKDSAVQSVPSYLARSTFPAASLIKTVTLAAALESRKYALHTEVPLIGKSTTLYKRQLKIPEKYNGNTISAMDTYAKSCNPTAAILGLSVGGDYLKKTGEKLGYNTAFPENIPETSAFNPPDTGFGLAEAASGFTQETTLSPLLAAAITRSILLKKSLEIPWSQHLPTGFAPSGANPLEAPLFSQNTYYGLKTAMLQTVKSGTGRKNISKRHISKRYLNRLNIGGKTGSKDGDDPPGRYDWFAGFAEDNQNPENAVIVVVMQAHGEMRSQPATQVAALLIQYWAKEYLSFAQ
ncbi:MAG: penicillin-binding protein [Fibrobacter sp.]|jgi:cell division protein FtsI/penicillin-binding protein 2|nr:penicillin-binding protein [Fibrobacter sp.]